MGIVVKAGDLTGDGLDELIIPNEYASEGLFTSEGACFIFRGRATWPTTINLASTAADITLLGGRADDNLGASAAVGDFNGDPPLDLAVAAPGADDGPLNDQRGDGFVYGLLGSSAFQTGTHRIDYATASADFTLIGDAEENLGTLVAAGDFNADGIEDLAAAERFAGPNANGVVEVLFGRPFSGEPTFRAGVNTDLRITGDAQFDRIGFWLTAADVNRDGLAEVVFSTPFDNNSDGVCYLFTYVSGDTDGNGRQDLPDVAAFQRCFLQSDGVELLPAACVLLDFDLDLDVDLSDWASLVALIDAAS
jgi:hypothetical protein